MDQKPQPYPLPPENPHLGLSPVRSGPFASRNADARYAEHLRSIHELIGTIASDVSATKEDFEDLSTRSRDNGQALERLMREIKGVREDDGVSQKLTGLAQLDHLQKLDKLRYLGKLNKLDNIEETLRGIQVPGVLPEGRQDAEGPEQLNQLNQLSQLSQLNQLEKLGQLRLLEHLKKLNSLENMEIQLNKLQELDRLKELQHLQSLEQLKHLDEFTGQKADLNLDNYFDELKALHTDTTKRLERLPTIEEQVRVNATHQSSSINELRKQLEGVAQSASIQELMQQIRALHTSMASDRELDSKTTVTPNDELQQLQITRLEDFKADQHEHFQTLAAQLEHGLKSLEELKALSELTSGLSNVSASLHELNHLSELSKLQSLKDLEKLQELDRLSSLDELKSLKLLEQLQSLEGLNRLENLDELKSLQQLNSLEQLKSLNKLGSLEKLDSLDSLKSLEGLQTLSRLDELKQLNSLGQLTSLDELKSLSKLDQLEGLKSLGGLERLEKLTTLDKLNLLDQLTKLEELKSLDKLKALDQLQSLDQLKSLDQLTSLSSLTKLHNLDKLNSLDELASLSQIGDIRGEIRAVQDHLIGMHKDAVQELQELRQFKQEVGPVINLRTEAEELEARVKQLREEERELLTNNTSLKTELRLGVDRLEDCESRYTKLETQLRNLTLSKYKGILGTGAMAVLSKSQNKENDLIIPKRQLRTVSLANH